MKWKQYFDKQYSESGFFPPHILRGHIYLRGQATMEKKKKNLCSTNSVTL